MSNSKEISSDFWVGLFSPLIVPVVVIPFVAIAIPVILMRAWVICQLWSWYVVPAFGLHPLRLIFGFGFSVLVTYLTPTGKKSDKTLASTAGQAVVNAGLTLLIGWIGSFYV